MPWWLGLILSATIAAVGVLLGYSWGRKSSSASVDRTALAASERAGLKAALAAEKAGRDIVATERAKLAVRLSQTLQWYNAQRDQISESARKEFNALLSNVDHLDRKLDSMLGTARAKKRSDG
mgnify:CR=1 FL=1